MPQPITTNRCIVLCRRPVGVPTHDDLRMETCAVPQPHAGQLLLRTLYLSLDPYVRGRTSAAPSYAARMALEDVMVSGTVSRVQESRHDSFEVGDLVLGCAGWQDYALSDGKGLKVLNRHEPHPSRALGVLGMTGFTGTPPGEVS